jgi:hypothetical protein
MPQYGSTLTEGKHKAECLISEANGSRSRDKATLLDGQVIVDGQIVTLSGGKYQAAVGTETASTLAVALGNYKDVNADQDIVVLKRDCEVRESVLTVTGNSGNRTTAIASLLTLGIVAR